MKTLQLAAAALAVGVLAFPAKAASTTTNDWWNVDFESPTPGGVSLEVGSLGPLTNNGQSATAPYTNGLWSASAEDESFITNSFNSVTTNGYQFGYNHCLKLDTQGSDLTWKPDPDKVAKADGLKTLVDADLWLVGSDSEPTEFDDGGDVQAAIYLKNELYDDQAEHAGDVSNSVLCVYVYDSIGKKNYWQELDGVALSNEAWAHVQVIVDHTSADPVVQVYVNQVRMHKRNGDPSDVNYDQWSLANPINSASETRVNSVAFRGTGAVDNFVGKTLEMSFDSAYFKALVYLDGEVTNELCKVTETKLDIGKVKAEFAGFKFDDKYRGHPATYALSKIEIVDFVNVSTVTYNYVYDKEERTITPDVPSPDIVFEYDDDDGVLYQNGLFSVAAATTGATLPEDPDEPIPVVNIYLTTLGSHNAIAETVVGGNTSTNFAVVKPADFEGGATKTVSWEFPAVDGGNVLSTIQVYNGAELSYANRKATVTKTLSTELDADTLFVTATYAAGTLADGKDLDPGDPVNGLYTFSEYTPPPPPVAIIVAGNVTNEYTSLALAVAAAKDNDTIEMVANTELSAALTVDKAITLDLAGFTITGGNTATNRIVVSSTGSLTIEDSSETANEPGTGKIVSNAFSYEDPGKTLIRVDGALVLNGGTIEALLTDTNPANGRVEQANAIAPFNTATITVSGGTIKAAGYALSLNGSASGPNFSNGASITINAGTIQSTGNAAVYVPAGQVTINGGDITGATGVYAKGGRLSVPSTSTATIAATGAAAAWTFRTDGTDSTGDALVIDNSKYVYGPALVTIAGGTFTSAYGNAIGNYAVAGEETASGFVSGGSFDEVVAVAYCAEGYEPVTEPDPVTGLYTVTEVEETYTIVFNNEDGSHFFTTSNVTAGETGYGPPTDPTTELIGVQFAGWTNLLDGATVYTTANLPAVTTNATYAAVFQALVPPVEPIPVVIGGDAVNALPAGTDPITIVDSGDTHTFTLRFAAKQTGVTYVLQAATTVNGAFADVMNGETKVAVTPQAIDEVVALTDPAATQNAKFYRVKVEVAE